MAGTVSRVPVRWIVFGVVAALTSVMASVATAGASAPRVSPCTLLTRDEVQAVVPGPVGKPIVLPAILPNGPNGMACDRISTVAAHNHRTAIFGVSVQLWDFRVTGPAWTAPWGTRAARYLRSLCTPQHPPAGSGIPLPATHLVSGTGDYACALDDAVVEVAKGPFLLRVSVGLNAPNKRSRDTVIALARTAARRLRS